MTMNGERQDAIPGDSIQNRRNPKTGKKRPSVFQCAGIVLAVVLLGVICFPWYLNARAWARDDQVKIKLYEIQRGVETYSVHHNRLYPLDVQLVIEEGFMDGFPVNPFTHQPMREIAFGETPSDGEFTYIPVIIDNKVQGYYLFCYGEAKKRHPPDKWHLDVDRDGVDDHVNMVVYNEYERWMAYVFSTSIPEPISGPKEEWPSLEELLRKQNETLQDRSTVAGEDIK